MADGYILEIPESVLKKLGQADDSIKALAKTSSETKDIVVSSFKSMADGMDPLLSKLKESKNLFSSIIPKSTNSDIAQTANALSKVSTLLNKVNKSSSANTSVLAWQGLNENIKIQQNRLNQLNKSIKEYETTMSRINSGKGGSVSRSDTTSYEANIKEANAIRQSITLYEEKQKKIISYQQEQKRMADLIAQATGTKPFTEEKKIDELRRLNEAYRNGVSELQKRAKAEDDTAKAVNNAVVALDKAAKAQQRKNDAENRRKNSDIAKQEREAAKAVEAYNNALKRSEDTISQRKSKIEALQKAQVRLTATGRDYSKEIGKISTETERLKLANVIAANSVDKLRQSQSKVLNTSEQLQRKLGLLFSVSAIEGYIKKLMQVRGEFELQQRALQAIIQNKDKANEIWDKTVALAVKSPFTVKQLVSYTKQLAAYRIETEKLYDTNKMLADVSAGLGVDMQRLILAFGQVKAANYLRGTELRQFSEAGINILGELATYFSEIENRAISVGEVFSMVSNRMVSFGDVEEVFRRITSAGGIFYNMQEIQAETLKGQISNLTDSIDIMLNDIGQSNDTVLKDFVSLLKNIVNNWEAIANVMIPVISSYGLYKGLMLTITTSQNLMNASVAILNKRKAEEAMLRIANTTAIKAEEAAQKKFNFTAKLNPYILFGSIIIGTITAMGMLIASANKKQKEFNKLINEGQTNARELSANFKRLADIVVDSNKSYSEQKKALDELKRSYGDIIPTQSLTIEKLKEMKGNYDAVTSAIYAKISAQLQEEKISEVTSKYTEDLTYVQGHLIDRLQEQNVSMEKARVISSTFTNDLQDLVKKGIDPSTKAFSILKELAMDFSGVDIKSYKMKNEIEWMIALVKTYQKEISNITPIDISIDKTKNTIIYQGFEKQMDTIQKGIDEFKEKNTGVINPWELNKNVQKKTIDQYGRFTKTLKKHIDSGDIDNKDLQIYLKAIEEAENRIKKVLGDDNSQKIAGLVEKAFKENKADLSKAVSFLKDESKSVEEYTSEIGGAINTYKKLLDESKKGLGPFTTKEEIENAKRILAALTTLKSYLPIYGKEVKTVENETNKKLKEQISLLKKVGEEYKNNLKHYGKEEALSKTKKDYSPAFDAAGFRKGFLDNMQLDASGIISALEDIGKKAGPAMKVPIEKAMSDLRGDLEISVKVQNIEQTKKEIERLFTGYELTVEIEGLGLDKSLIKQLFDVDAISIDDIKNKLSEIFPNTDKLSGEQLKVYKDTQKKILDIQKKDLEIQLKEYSKYLKKTISERALAEIELQQEIAKIRKNEKLSEPQKKQIIEEKTKETRIKQSTIDWSEFKESEVYIQLFEKLEYKSSSVLAVMKDGIDKLKDSMSQLTPEQLKSINEYYSKLENELTDRNPLSSLKEAMKEIKDLRRQGKNEESLSEDLLKYNEQANALKLQISDIETIIGLKENNLSLDSLNEDILKRNKDLIGLSADELRNLNEIKKSDLSGTENNISVTGKDLESFEKARESVSKLEGKFNTIRDVGKKAFESISSILEDIGVDSDSTGMILANMGMSLVDMVAQAIMFGLQLKVMQVQAEAVGVAMNAAMGPIGWALIALQALTSIFSAFTKIHDNKKQKEIDKEKEKIEELEKAYKKLEKSIESAYSLDTLKESNDLAEKNIQSQIESRKAMIAAEKEKKKIDNDQIKEWENEIEELNEKSEELKRQLITDVGGFGTGDDMKSAAEDFTSAWLDAFNETGDGLKGLEGVMDDWIQNIMRKQIMLRLSEKFITPVLDKINGMLEKESQGGEEVMESELNALKRLSDRKISEFNEAAKKIMEDLGLKPTGGDKELSGLQQGIQAVTETTAQALEALLNSIRFFVSDSNAQLKNIALYLGNDVESNPLLSELRIQTEIIRSINSFLSSVIVPGHRLGMSGVKVFMD